ncbi:hypothetical protein NX059_011861 [Plenodomus lindquistii]|nr:hypothetical protein NX059_011861 [Plenodomus lindquistii]
MAGEYEQWSQQQLIARIQELEKQLKDSSKSGSPSAPAAPQSTSLPSDVSDDNAKTQAFQKAPKAPPKAFDASRYSTRLIALKFAYLGQKYNGFEHHKNNSTPLPTVEEELWKALVKTRLINPIPTQDDPTKYKRLNNETFITWDREGADVNWDGCEYSKCGRTDRGVSAFGQVIGVRVRSNKPLPKSPTTPADPDTMNQGEEGQDLLSTIESDPAPEPKPFNDLTDELPYIQHLNRVLPPDIRVYAWCADLPADFSARFSCKERRYKYFFTNPSFAPVPGSAGLYNTHNKSAIMREGWLDISAMKAGCAQLIGLHDFRNFCKIDASKQISNFQRRIFHADIEQVSPLSVPEFLSHVALTSPSNTNDVQQPKLYAFTLHGSAFLWHQVRSLISILFLIGQGLEPPSLIPSLLDISSNPTRPKYEMASDAPLVLWDCIFPSPAEAQASEEREHGYEDALPWIYVGDEGGADPKLLARSNKTGASTLGRGKWGRGGVMDDAWEVWRKAKIEETLSGLLLDRIAGLGGSTLDREVDVREQGVGIAKTGPRVFDGGEGGKAKGMYVPVLKRERQESVEVINEKYRARREASGRVVKGGKGREDGDE